jgi:uncharacterized protein
MNNRRRALALAVVLILVTALRAFGQAERRGVEAANGTEKLGVTVPMRDGIELAADVFLPEPKGRFPTILFRTPYNRKGPSSHNFRTFTNLDYAVVIEDVRGRLASQGVFGPISQEGPDGYDTINWIAAQPWSNGRVVMSGGSYLGITQWWAAVENNPHLAAISPMFSGDDEYLDRFYSTGGAMKLGHRLLWIAENFTPPAQVRPLFASYIDHLPLRTADISATGLRLDLWRDCLDHPSYDSYWKRQSIRERWRDVRIPVLSWGGWFDNYAESDLDMFSRLALGHKDVETWIGPWGHNPALQFPTVFFGKDAIPHMRGAQVSWFNRWVNRQPNSVQPAGRPLLHLFVMGPDVWREEHEWPLARTRYTPFYLGSGGHANSLRGDGELQPHPVRTGAADTFVYDPRDPVPTAGGAICCDPRILPPGPLEQNKIEQRGDVLVYTSPPLNDDTEVTGPVRAVLYVSTSANDTDFTAKLVDVQRDGRALLVTDGIQRMRYRLSLDHPVFVKRNAAYQITVDAGVTSYVFPAGHRIRLEISSSNFPRFDRNLNSSAPNGDITKIIKAKQTVFHEKSYPSALILPVIPRTGLRSVARSSDFGGRNLAQSATRDTASAERRPR